MLLLSTSFAFASWFVGLVWSCKLVPLSLHRKRDPRAPNRRRLGSAGTPWNLNRPSLPRGGFVVLRSCKESWQNVSTPFLWGVCFQEGAHRCKQKIWEHETRLLPCRAGASRDAGPDDLVRIFFSITGPASQLPCRRLECDPRPAAAYGGGGASRGHGRRRRKGTAVLGCCSSRRWRRPPNKATRGHGCSNGGPPAAGVPP